jgi:hypothetical protein
LKGAAHVLEAALPGSVPVRSRSSVKRPVSSATVSMAAVSPAAVFRRVSEPGGGWRLRSSSACSSSQLGDQRSLVQPPTPLLGLKATRRPSATARALTRWADPTRCDAANRYRPLKGRRPPSVVAPDGTDLLLRSRRRHESAAHVRPGSAGSTCERHSHGRSFLGAGRGRSVMARGRQDVVQSSRASAPVSLRLDVPRASHRFAVVLAGAETTGVSSAGPRTSVGVARAVLNVAVSSAFLGFRLPSSSRTQARRTRGVGILRAAAKEPDRAQ